jgi:hypothetical protein
MAQWSSNPNVNNQITPNDYGIYDNEFVTTKDGTTYIVFSKVNFVGIATYLQIVTKDGRKLFPDTGRLISNYQTLSYTTINGLIYADNDGNALIFVDDGRHYQPSEYPEKSYTVYKVSPTGEFLWNSNGVDVGRGATRKLIASINGVQLENGNYILAWQSGGETASSLSITVEQLDKVTGALLWDQALEIKGTQENSYPKLVSAGNNQVILTYVKGASRALTVRKIDFDGESVWSPEDVQVYRGSYTIPALDGVFSVAPDDKGGVFVGWYDDRNGTNRESTYISYVKSNGQFGFQTVDGSGAVKAGYGQDYLRQFKPQFVYDKTNDKLFATWRETNNNQAFTRIVVQKLASSGELLWGEHGLEVASADHPESVAYPSVRKATNGNAAVFYMLSYYPDREVHNLAALYNGNGDYLWSSYPPESSRRTGVQFSTYGTTDPNNAYKGNKAALKSSSLINDAYWLTIWEDLRYASSFYSGSLFMQKVNLDGTLGGNFGTAIQLPEALKANDWSVTPSIIKDNATFTVNNPKAGNVNISVYSSSGQKVAVVYNGKLAAGTQTIPWNVKSTGLSSGAYVTILTTIEGSKSNKIVVY